MNVLGEGSGTLPGSLHKYTSKQKHFKHFHSIKLTLDNFWLKRVRLGSLKRGTGGGLVNILEIRGVLDLDEDESHSEFTRLRLK